MLELLVAVGLILLSRTTISDIISVSSLAKGLISRIGEKDAIGILKKAIDKTSREAEDAEIKEILDGLRDKEELLHEFRAVNVEAKEELVSKYFKGKSDVLELLAKNYYELFCTEAIKKDRPFREFVVIELGKLTNQGVITDDAVKRVERHLQGIIEEIKREKEEIKREKEAASRQFIITDDLNVVSSEILAGKPPIEYVEREEIEKVKGALKTTNKLLVVGKPGAGKSRFLLRILEAFNSYEKFVVIRSFFREDGISSLDAELQKLNSFILVWDDLHSVKKEIVNQTINQIERLAKDYGKEYLFIGASRMEREYYQFKQEEIKLDEFRSLELIENCSAYFDVSVDGGVKKTLLEVGDGTPFYVISLFATSKERGKKRLTGDDLKTLPKDSFAIWHDHLNFLESEGRLSTSEKNVLRSIALAMMAVPAIDFAVLEKFYAHIFRGNLSEFDYALDGVLRKFFIGIEDEHCSMHAVQAAVVDERYPVEEHKIEQLKEVLTSLKKDKSLILLLAFADWLDASKKYVDYLKFLDVFIEKEPNIADAYNNRGLAYAGLNQHERAIADYDKATELNPNLVEVYNNRGVSYAKLNQHEEAIKNYNKAIELNPDLAGIYNNRGTAYYRLKKHERAIADYNKTIELNPNLSVAYCYRGNAFYGMNQYERAIADYNRAIELNPDLAEAYTNRGFTYYGLNQHELAIADYNKAIELNPDLAEAYTNRGIAYWGLSQHELAIADYNKAIELNPNFSKAYYNRGNAYAGLKQRERAIADYSKTIELNPTYAEASEAYYNRGNAYAGLKQRERAIADYNKAIELNPSYAEVYNNRGNANAGLNQHERAIADYNKAIELNPNLAEVYNNRGSAYFGLKQHERAIEDYNKAIELNPNYAEAYNNRGGAYGNLNEHERAIKDYNRAIELNPNYAEAYNSRGITYYRLKKHERAIEDYNKAIELNPSYAEAYNSRGIAYYRLKKHERAIEDYNKALELSPNYAEAYGSRGIAHSKIGRYEESARDLKKAGILFFDSGNEEDSVKVFSFCFNLRPKIENADVIYSGLVLFLITLDPDVIIELRQLRIEDETLIKIFELTLMKLRDEDISDGIAMLEQKEKTEEKKILFELLKAL